MAKRTTVPGQNGPHANDTAPDVQSESPLVAHRPTQRFDRPALDTPAGPSEGTNVIAASSDPRQIRGRGTEQCLACTDLTLSTSDPLPGSSGNTQVRLDVPALNGEIHLTRRHVYTAPDSEMQSGPQPGQQGDVDEIPPLVRLREPGTRAVNWRPDPTPNQTRAALRHYAESIGATDLSVRDCAGCRERKPLGDWVPGKPVTRLLRMIKRLLFVAVVSALIVLGTACTESAPSSGLAELHEMVQRCSGAYRVAFIASDESETSRDATSQPVRQQVIRDEVTRTAVCGGHFRLTVFSGSQVGQTVFDGDLRADGATEVARLRKVPKIVDETMNAVNKALPAARDKLPGDGTDTTAQYQVAAEYFAQAKPTTGTALMEFTMLTDGISTVPARLTDHDLTAAEATQLARTVTSAQVPGVAVRIIGVGRTNGDGQLPSTYVDALKAFHTEICHASKAASCLIVTDPESGGAK